MRLLIVFEKCLGGGYEIAAFYDGEFKKISCDFIFLEVSLLKGSIKIGNPNLIISQTYSGSVLNYRVVCPRGGYDDVVDRDEVVEVKPIINLNDNKISSWVDPEIYFACFVFVDGFKFFGNKLISTVVISKTRPVEFDVNEGRLRIQYSPGASKQIIDFVRDVYG